MLYPTQLVHWSGDPYSGFPRRFSRRSRVPEVRADKDYYSLGPGGISLNSMALTAAWVRSDTSSLEMMRSRCLLTVERERCSCWAIWRLVLPEARWPMTSVSLGVSGLDVENAEAAGSTEVDGCVCGHTFSCTAASSPMLLRSFMASPWSRGVSPSSTALTASRTWSGFSPFRT